MHGSKIDHTNSGMPPQPPSIIFTWIGHWGFP